MKKTLILLLILCSVINDSFSQKKEIERIKDSNEYIWGMGQATDPKSADDNAIEDLISKISIRIESSFTHIAEESSEEGYREYSKSVLRTYSDASLNNVQQIQYVSRNIYYTLRFIKKVELQDIYNLREDKIKGYLNTGTAALEELRIGDALRQYYYSYSLYLTHPYKKNLKIDVDDKEVLLGIFLQDRISSLLTHIKFKLKIKIKDSKNNKSKLLLECTYKNQPIENLSFIFHNGKNMSYPQEVLGGKTEIILYGSEQTELENLNIYIDYKYLEKAIHDKELSKVLKITQSNSFHNHKTVFIHKNKAGKLKPKKMFQLEFSSLNELKDSKKFYIKSINKILIAIEEKDYQKAYTFLSPEGKEMFNKLLKNGQVSVLPLKDTLNIIQLDGETMVRSIKMKFYFPNSRKSIMENVVFTFNNSTKKIDAISFAISDQSIKDITNHSAKFGSVQDKYTLIKFMEYYKTSYSLKRLDYIESIFAEEALIIVGNVLKRSKPIDDMYKQIGDSEIRYQKRTKKDYISKLRSVFSSSEYINLEFNDAEVKKVNGSQKIYGIQISQSYESNRYSDSGYLFLMIDLSDTLENPQIYVRTWQPEKISNCSIYELEDFPFN